MGQGRHQMNLNKLAVPKSKILKRKEEKTRYGSQLEGASISSI